MRSQLTILLIIAVCAPAWSQWDSVMAGDETVYIHRDGYGVPHVVAPSDYAVYFGQGYVCAQDRPAQLDLYRRTARGALSEILGEDRLGHDRQRRTTGYSDLEHMEIFRSATRQSRTAILGLRDGINARFRELRASGDWPEHYTKLGYEPKPWTIIDSTAIGMMMVERFGDGGDDEVDWLERYEALSEKLGAAEALTILRDLVPFEDPSAPTTIPGKHMSRLTLGPASGGVQSLRGHAEHLAGYVEERREMFATARELGVFTGWGSNAWVVAPKKSRGRAAMLFGGPMMGFQTPQIAYEVHLMAPGLNVIGMAFAGVPSVLIGHTPTTAWTTTSGAENITDIFEEQLDPARENAYLYQGELLPMEHRTETIRVRENPGESPAQYREEKLDVRRTIHGPVIKTDDEDGIAYSLSRPWWKHFEFDLVSPFSKFNRAQTPEEFVKACAEVWSTHNFFFANIKGDIAYAYSGMVPYRDPRVNPLLPTPGTGEYDWKGFIAWEDMPKSINPREGYFGNWNNKSALGWPSPYGKIFWGVHIYQKLAERGKLDMEAFQHIAWRTAYDCYQDSYFRPHLFNALEREPMASDPRRIQVHDTIHLFDGVRGKGKTAAAIYDAWIGRMRALVFDEVFEAVGGDGGSVRRYLLDNVLLRLLDGNNAAVQPAYDYLRGRDILDVASQAMQETLDNLRDKHGPDMGEWGPEEDTIDFGDTGKIASASGRGTYMQAIRLPKSGAEGFNVLPPGQSEDPDSPHWNDQLGLYEAWKYKPTTWNLDDLPPLPEN